MKQDEGELLRRVRAGDAQALETIMRRYQDSMVNYVCVMGLPEQAEDLVQEAFLRLCKPQERYREIDDLSKYLAAIVTHLANSELRKVIRFRELLPRFALLAPKEAPAADDGLRTQEIQRNVMAALRKMNRNHRVALLLYAREDCTYEEIAIITKSRVGTVRSRISRAREELHTLLADWWIGAEHDRRADHPSAERAVAQKGFTRLHEQDPEPL